MRTTLNLDDDVYQLVRQYAESRSQPLGKAVSELVKRGLNSSLRTKLVNGFHVLELPPDTPPVTTEHVKHMEAESERVMVWTTRAIKLCSNFT
jgi:hypothetical protein